MGLLLEMDTLVGYRIAENLGGRKLCQIWQFVTNPPKFYPPIAEKARGWA